MSDADPVGFAVVEAKRRSRLWSVSAPVGILDGVVVASRADGARRGAVNILLLGAEFPDDCRRHDHGT